jgi:hypothetical protein
MSFEDRPVSEAAWLTLPMFKETSRESCEA